MAAMPDSFGGSSSLPLSEDARLSHGRGGAGNIEVTNHDTELIDFNAPVLTNEVYTTGRGGTGNMAKNTDLEEIRRAQDVVTYPRHESVGGTHAVRSDSVHIHYPPFHPSVHDIVMAKSQNLQWEQAAKDEEAKKAAELAHMEECKGWADRGKDWISKQLRKRKERKAQRESRK